jgi:hypothetical protein
MGILRAVLTTFCPGTGSRQPDPVSGMDAYESFVVFFSAAKRRGHYVKSNQPISKRQRKPVGRTASAAVVATLLPPSSISIPEEVTGARQGNRLVSNRINVQRHLGVLIEALEEVTSYDFARRHNQPLPALWLSDAEYLRDVKALLVNARELNEMLRDLVEGAAPEVEKAAQNAARVVALGTANFIDSYAGALGKGAAALTIGAVGSLAYHLGSNLEDLQDIWGRLKRAK